MKTIEIDLDKLYIGKEITTNNTKCIVGTDRNGKLILIPKKNLIRRF